MPRAGEGAGSGPGPTRRAGSRTRVRARGPGRSAAGSPSCWAGVRFDPERRLGRDGRPGAGRTGSPGPRRVPRAVSGLPRGPCSRLGGRTSIRLGCGRALGSRDWERSLIRAPGRTAGPPWPRPCHPSRHVYLHHKSRRDGVTNRIAAQCAAPAHSGRTPSSFSVRNPCSRAWSYSGRFFMSSIISGTSAFSPGRPRVVARGPSLRAANGAAGTAVRVVTIVRPIGRGRSAVRGRGPSWPR